MNYNARAKKLANYVHSRRLENHRGVMPLGTAEACVVFGNDDYSGNSHTREMVRLLFDACYEAGVPVLGFATNDGDNDSGCCWSLVLATDNSDWVKARLHDAFFESHGLYAPRSLALATAEVGHWRTTSHLAPEKPR
ncbi:MAG TPA: hypothetical protein VHC22_25215 [Pirellulales bacterium]|nr:hypothetical protein [Pirellulales bacterium]